MNQQRQCVIEEKSPVIVNKLRKVLENYEQKVCDSWEYSSEIIVPIRFIHCTWQGKGIIAENQRIAQVDYLNQYLNQHDIKITYDPKNVVYVNRYDLFNLDYNGRNRVTLKNMCFKAGFVNCYTANLAEDLLGWATWPEDYQIDKKLDGVVVHYQSMTGGTMDRYNLGGTLLHELGHWLGLLHTFQGGCDGINDGVKDTPAQRGPHFSIMNKKWCTGRGMLTPDNVMDYIPDKDMVEFTAGQAKKARVSVRKYRPEFIKPKEAKPVSYFWFWNYWKMPGGKLLKRYSVQL